MEKVKKPFYKKIWFWIVVIVVVCIIAVANGGDNSNTTPQEVTETPVEEAITYEQLDLQTMIDDLKANALKAEKTYMNKNVEVTGKIANFDSDGNYISIEPVNADEWNLNTVTCNVEDDAQLDILLEKSVGDTVTIKGEVTSVGELLGYSIDIEEVY